MKLGIIGCGKMGSALVGGVVSAGVVEGSNVLGAVRPTTSQEVKDHFLDATGGQITDQIEDLAECDVVLLGTKPHDIKEALSALSAAAKGRSLLAISLAAGVSLESLESAVGDHIRVIRSMPNTPSLVGKGAAAYCLGRHATGDDSTLAEKLLGAVGLAILVPERLMNAVTGVSGSGPAYVYLMIEAMADGGVRQGLPRADAIKLAAQTVYGAASMVIETGQHPAVLKDMVTSPGGTTIAALSALETHGLRSAMIAAVEAAAKRGQELDQ